MFLPLKEPKKEVREVSSSTIDPYGFEMKRLREESIAKAMWEQRDRDNADIARHFERMEEVKARIIRQVRRMALALSSVLMSVLSPSRLKKLVSSLS